MNRFYIINVARIAHLIIFALVALALSTSTRVTAQTPVPSKPESTSAALADVARLLSAKCLACHKQDKSEGSYSMDTLAALMKPGDSGRPPVVAGDVSKSELYRRLTTTDPDERMPADSPPLTEEEIKLVRDWINSKSSWNSEVWSQPISRLASRSIKTAPEHYAKLLPITALALDQAAQSVWVSGYAEVLLWNISKAEVIERLPISGTQVVGLELSPDNQVLAVSCGVAGEFGSVQLWQQSSVRDSSTAVKSKWQLRWTEELDDIAADVAFSPDGTRLAIGCSDGALEVAELSISAESFQVRTNRWTPHADAILAVNWSDKGDRLVTGSRDRTAKIFDATKMELIANYDRHERAVGGVTYLDDNPVSFDETGKLRLWTGDDNDRTLAEKDNLARFVEPLVHHDDQLWLADQSRLRHFKIERKTLDDGKDEAGNPKTKKVLRWREQSTWESERTGWIISISVTPSAIAVGDDRGQVTVWSTKDRKVLAQFKANP